MSDKLNGWYEIQFIQTDRKEKYHVSIERDHGNGTRELVQGHRIMNGEVVLETKDELGNDLDLNALPEGTTATVGFFVVDLEQTEIVISEGYQEIVNDEAVRITDKKGKVVPTDNICFRCKTGNLITAKPF